MREINYENKAVENRVVMRYIGGSIPGVPRKDLTLSDIDAIKTQYPELEDIEMALENSGVYERVAYTGRRK